MKKFFVILIVLLFPFRDFASEVRLKSGFDCPYVLNEQFLGVLENGGSFSNDKINVETDIFILYGKNFLMDIPEVMIYLEEIKGVFGIASGNYTFTSHNSTYKRNFFNEIGVYGAGGGIDGKNGTLYITKMTPCMKGGLIGSYCRFFDSWNLECFYLFGNMICQDIYSKQMVTGDMNMYGSSLNKQFSFQCSDIQLKTGIIFGDIFCSGKLPLLETIFLRNESKFNGTIESLCLFWDYKYELKIGNVFLEAGIKGIYLPLFNGVVNINEETFFLGKKEDRKEMLRFDMKNSLLCLPSVKMEYTFEFFKKKLKLKLGVEKTIFLPVVGEKIGRTENIQDMAAVMLGSGNKLYGEIRF